MNIRYKRPKGIERASPGCKHKRLHAIVEELQGVMILRGYFGPKYDKKLNIEGVISISFQRKLKRFVKHCPKSQSYHFRRIACVRSLTH